jgi:hypothetical protein
VKKKTELPKKTLSLAHATIRTLTSAELDLAQGGRWNTDGDSQKLPGTGCTSTR